eukprot:12880577-Prorocentrum_lima.AAC.1
MIPPHGAADNSLNRPDTCCCVYNVLGSPPDGPFPLLPPFPFLEDTIVEDDILNRKWNIS